MNLTEIGVTLTVVLGAGAAAFVAVDMPRLTGGVQTTADKATCHAAENAFAAYTTAEGRPPRTIADIAPYVSGDLTEYRITPRGVTGPGCRAA